MTGTGPATDAGAEGPEAPVPVLKLEGLVKRYGTFTAVRGVDLEVHSGEIFGFLGPNGAGKTTTIRMVAGILQPSEGRIRVGGVDLATEAGVARKRSATFRTVPSSTKSSRERSSSVS